MMIMIMNNNLNREREKKRLKKYLLNKYSNYKKKSISTETKKIENKY